MEEQNRIQFVFGIGLFDCKSNTDRTMTNIRQQLNKVKIIDAPILSIFSEENSSISKLVCAFRTKSCPT